MNSKDLYYAVNEVDDDILERSEVVAAGCKKKNGWLKWCAAAACLCLAIMGTVIWTFTSSHKEPSHKDGTGLTVSENGVTIPIVNDIKNFLLTWIS